MTEQEFRVRSDEAIQQARRALLPLADSEGFEVELHDGVQAAVHRADANARQPGSAV